MTHPLVSRLAPLMDGELNPLRSIVADWLVRTDCDRQRAVLRHFGAELGAVQRRIRSRRLPPSLEEIEIALTAVLALMQRRVEPEVSRLDPAGFLFSDEVAAGPSEKHFGS